MSGKSGHPEAGPGEYPPEPADGAAKGMNFGMTGPHPERNNPPTAFDVKGLHHLLRGLPDDVLKQIPVMTPGRPLEEGAVYIDLHAPGTGEFRAVGGVEAGPDNWFVPKELVHYQVWNWLIGVTDSQRIGDIRPG